MTVGTWWKERQEVQALDRAEADSRERMQKALDAAKSSGANADDQERIRQDHLHDVFSYQDRRAVIQSLQLVRKARRLMLPIPSRTENSDIWILSSLGGGWLLTDEGQFTLRKSIREEEKFRREFWQSWTALIIGLLGAIIGVVSVWPPG